MCVLDTFKFSSSYHCFITLQFGALSLVLFVKSPHHVHEVCWHWLSPLLLLLLLLLLHLNHLSTVASPHSCRQNLTLLLSFDDLGGRRVLLLVASELLSFHHWRTPVLLELLNVPIFYLSCVWAVSWLLLDEFNAS